MAYGTSMVVDIKNRFRKAGITVELYPSTVRGLMVELQSATANTTVSSAWQSVYLGPSTAGTLRHTLNVPYSTRLVYMKARHPAGNGYSNGPFTATISARSKFAPDILPLFPIQMGYQGNVEVPAGSDVFVSSSKTVKVGTQPSTGKIQKVHRIAAEEALVDTSTETWDVSNGYLKSRAGGGAVGGQAPVLLTPGVRVTKFRTRAFRGASTVTQVLGLFRRISSTGGLTNLSTSNQATTGWVTTTGGSVSETISTQYSYHVRITMNTTASRFLFWELVYEMPDYAKSF